MPHSQPMLLSFYQVLSVKCEMSTSNSKPLKLIKVRWVKITDNYLCLKNDL